MEGQLSAITSIPTGLQILLKDLDYLAQIPRGLKPCVKTRDFVDDHTWGGWFYRTFIVKESRKDVLAEVEKIIERAVDAIKNHKETEYIKVIIEYFYKARTGVANLSITYKGSPDIVSGIKVQLTNMDLQIKRYQQYIDGYKVENNDFPISSVPSVPISVSSSVPSTPISQPSPLKKTNELDLFDSNTIPSPPSISSSRFGNSSDKKVKKQLKLKRSTDLN